MSNIPAWLLLVGLTLVIVVGAVLIQSFVRRRYPALKREDHNDVTRFTYGVIGFVYAFVVGFVVSSMWGEIHTADADARGEGAAAVQMVRDLTVFDKGDGDRIRQTLLAYERAAIAEWVQAGVVRSPEADTALNHLYGAYEQVQARTDLQKTFLATSLSNLDSVSKARTERILQARSDVGPPWPLWMVIVLTSAMVLGTVIIYGGEKPAMHCPMVAIVGALVAINLFLVLELSHPFVGEVATTPDPLHEVIWALSHTV